MNAYFLYTKTLVLAVASFAAVSSAHAEDKIGISVSAHANYGINVNPPDGNDGIDIDYPDPFRFGAGLRAGYTLPCGIYVGGFFDYYAGETVRIEQSVFGSVADFEISMNSYHVGGEIGYDFELAQNIVLRPVVGFGRYQLSTDVEFGGGQISSVEGDDYTSFAVSPGILANIGIGSTLFVTAGARTVLPTELWDDTVRSVTFSVGVGAQF